MAAGDIACQDSNPTESECHQQATSDLVLSLQPDWVLDLGDNQYEDGSLDEFETYYDPTWGRFPTTTPTRISTRATETPTRMLIIDAARAMAIHTKATQ